MIKRRIFERNLLAARLSNELGLDHEPKDVKFMDVLFFMPNNLQLKFEAVSQMSEEDKKAIQSLIDGMILKHTASQLGTRHG